MLTFVVPGRLDQITGGYLYDRRVIEGARVQGRDVELIELPGRYPDADATACAAAVRSLDALPDGRVVVIDGLALPAFASCMEAHVGRLRIVGFVHHPLAMETGLTPAATSRYAAMESRLWQCMHAILCPSASTARALTEAGVSVDRIAIVPPGTERPASIMQRTTSDPLRLLSVGTLCIRKGQDLLIEALAELKSLPWVLECIGSAERSPAYADALRASIARHTLEKRVTLRGELPPSQLGSAYAAADVFVLPSFHEGYGMAYAEALVNGLPVIGTTGGAIADTVPTSAGLLVEPGNVGALRDALRDVILDRELRVRLSDGAMRAGNALPTWPQTVTRWLRSLDRLTA